AEKPFKLTKIGDVIVGSERNKINGILISTMEPRGNFALTVSIVQVDGGFVKILGFRDDSHRLHAALKDAEGRHVSFSIMPAQLEDDKFIDPKFGRLIQLNFGRSSEVKVIDDGFQLEDGGNKDEEPHASKEPSKRLMLQELVNGDTEGFLHLQLLAKTVYSPPQVKEEQGGPRFGSAATDGFHKAEIYFRFSEAKYYLPPEEFDIHDFEAEMMGQCLKLTVPRKKDIVKAKKTINAEADEDDYDFPMAGVTGAEETEVEKEEESSGDEK
ncbi:hypothetical protein AAVH_24742, partial [Aphelenchoides avenae]